MLLYIAYYVNVYIKITFLFEEHLPGLLLLDSQGVHTNVGI